MGESRYVPFSFKALAADADLGYAMMGEATVKVQRLGQGAVSGSRCKHRFPSNRDVLCQAFGGLRAGTTTKILALTDGIGNRSDFSLIALSRICAAPSVLLRPP